MLLGRLGGVPNKKPIERAVRRVYRLRLPEQDATVKPLAPNAMLGCIFAQPLFKQRNSRF